jgi:hypothetical protein
MIELLNQALDSIVRARASAEARGGIKHYLVAIAFVCAGDLLRRAFLHYGGFRAGVLGALRADDVAFSGCEAAGANASSRIGDAAISC